MAKALIDLDTGELSQLQTKPKKRDFVMSVQDAVLALAGNKSFSGSEYKVLLTLIGLMEYGGHIVATHNKLASITGLSKVSVSSAMAKLVESGLVEKGDYNGVRCYRVNPELAQKGKA